MSDHLSVDCIYNFKPGYGETSVINERYIGPNESLFTVTYGEGLFHIYEVDFISSFEDVKKRIKSLIGRDFEFVEVYDPLENFEDSAAFEAADTYKVPEDFEQMKIYLNEYGLTQEHYLTFMVKGKQGDTVAVWDE